MRYDGAGPKRMHSGIMAITAINWKMAIVPSRFEATAASCIKTKTT